MAQLYGGLHKIRREIMNAISSASLPSIPQIILIPILGDLGS